MQLSQQPDTFGLRDVMRTLKNAKQKLATEKHAREWGELLDDATKNANSIANIFFDFYSIVFISKHDVLFPLFLCMQTSEK